MFRLKTKRNSVWFISFSSSWWTKNMILQSPPPPHTHTWFCYNCEDFHILILFLYWPNNIWYCPAPTLPLNLALTGDILHFTFQEILNFVFFIFIPLWGPAKCPHKANISSFTILVGTYSPHTLWQVLLKRDILKQSMTKKYIYDIKL